MEEKKLSLFDIEYNLEKIFFELEENGGELTPELEAELMINQENLKQKLAGYRHVLSTLDMKVEAADKELKRLGAFKSANKNKYERLKDMCLKAVLAYGDTGKSGNKIVECDVFKMYTRDTKVVKVDELLINKIIDHCVHLVGEADDEANIGDIDTDYIVSYVNHMIKAEHEHDVTELDREAGVEEKPFVPITRDDLTTINVNINYEMPLVDFLSALNRTLFNHCYSNPHNTTVNPIINKKYIGSILDMKTTELTIASMDKTTSLTIK